MWRDGFDNPPNYNDNELNCGGAGHQHGPMQGKCGPCGDPWNQPTPRDNEFGGKFGNGVVTRLYQTGQVIDITVEITANHRGWFEFRICSQDTAGNPITNECFDNNILEFEDGSKRWHLLQSENKPYHFKVKLPDNLECQNCVIQWKWNCGNSWGQDPGSGSGCVGCGPQEQFYGCSDVAIGKNFPPPATAGPTPSVPATDPTPSPWPSSIPGVRCRGIGEWLGDPNKDKWCELNCAHFPPNCPQDKCFCELS
ncbi:DgyrCDS8793 [Dimorphilus gyrociliatus]|uniref:DgyrCDS8793 n=1 Tax=Dimorphilus gyrociliatus TaxID=2664684 RepID=A0A7I8VV53_9ANNE|nr:DgyrCDS8793 [Dimorphilus gyrociliatus]